MHNRATFGKALSDADQPRSGAGDFLRLIGLGTATFLSYWTLFFALQRAYTGSKKTPKTFGRR